MTRAIRARILTFHPGVLPRGIGFSLLLLFPLAALSQTPTFATHSFTSAVNNSVVLHGDLNHDGYEDLITSTNTGASRVYLSKGNGAYTALAVSISASPSLLGDFNGDGKLDLIAGNQMYFGQGDGTFRSGAAIAIPPDFIAMAAADVNHDGKRDLLILTANAASILVLLGNGDGTFRPGPETSLDNGDECCVDVQLLTGDFDGDGNVDAVVAEGWGAPTGYYGTRIRLFPGHGDGNFSATIDTEEDVKLNLSVADVNADGKSDLIGTAVFWDQIDYYLGQLYVYYGQSDGSMTPGWIDLETGKWGVGQVAVADFNGDGIPDAAVFDTDCQDGADCTLTSAATLHVVPGKGDGTFGNDTPLSGLESNPGPLFALRSNRDTKADLVFTNPTANNTPIITLLNTTSGNFPTCAAPNAAIGIAQCSPAAGSTVNSPVNFAIGVAAAEPVRKVEVWADGKKQLEQFAGAFSNYGFLNASVPLAAGSHRINVIAAGWDNVLQSKVSTINVSASGCSAPGSAGVHICSPSGGSTVSSPVKVQATAKVTGTIARTQLWIDGVKKVSTTSNSLTTSISLAAGTHRFAVVAANTAGQKWESAVTATVGGTSSCSAPSSAGVQICSPASGSTVHSPVRVQATAKITGTVAGTQLWVDGAKKYTSTSLTLDTSVSLAAGSHRFAVVASNTAGQKWETAVDATVQ